MKIPTAAWTRGIGVPYETPGRPRVDVPMIDDGPWGGVPLGGLGAGSIGRTHRGDFARWHLEAGVHRFESLPANTFAVYVEQNGERQAHVLAPLRPEVLKAWNWDMPVGAGTYHALFPRAWFAYDWPALGVRLTQKQFSPVIPGNYQESSYPVGVFEWEMHNPTDAPMTVGLMFAWQNLVGHWEGRGRDGENVNAGFRREGEAGVVLGRGDRTPQPPSPLRQAPGICDLKGEGARAAEQGGEADGVGGRGGMGDALTAIPVSEHWDGSFAIVAREGPGVRASYWANFALDEGAGVWADFAADGGLEDVAGEAAPARQGLGGAVAVTVRLAPGETRTVPFALAWDFPRIRFGAGREWYRRYTKFYGCSGRNAAEMAREALRQYPAWERAIEAWQRPILDDPARPEWYKTALFNELYWLVDGGSLWENGQAAGLDGTAGGSDGMGSYAFMECFDYPFYNTFDVSFYASYALLLLWPELEKQMMRDFARAVPRSDDSLVEIESNHKLVARKRAGAVPHDLGGPADDPLVRVNWYRWQDINIWKDLNCKFVLQLWRDYVVTGDAALVRDAWPAAVQALEYLRQFDRDGDGLPEHDNVPDQTYDTWSMEGPSAYGGSLWLAALQAAAALARVVGATATGEGAKFAGWLATGQGAFEAKLWNGRYYLYDGADNGHSDSIMADQLAGQWYADATGLAEIAPAAHVHSALRTVYNFNVRGFAGGQMGAVNGMRPDGSVDESSEQSAEVWTGTTYALAAFMLHRGMRDEAWATAWGAYNVTYNRGYWFRTPEAYDAAGNFRASLYMRPLSIWAMEHALTWGEAPRGHEGGKGHERGRA